MKERVPAAAAASTSRNAGIDLLRGLCILLVVLHHVGLRIPLKKTALGDFVPTRFLDASNYNGYEAVFVFFVVSGFLITKNALQRWERLERIDAPAFYARRFARIMPCLVVLVAVLSGLHLLGVQDYTIDRAGQSLPRAIGAALAMHLNWYEGTTGYLPGNWDVLWSLSIEEAFYLGFPLVCLLTRRTWVLAPLLLLLAISMPWSRAALAGNEIWQEKAYLPGMSAIAVGVIGALLERRWPTISVRRARALVVVGACGMTAVMLVSDWIWPVLRDKILLLLTGSAVLALIGLSAWPARALRGFGWICSWGRLSYEIYLSHMFVVFAVTRLYRAAGGNVRSGYLWYLVALPLSWLLGWLVARRLSEPCERWLRTRMLTRHRNAVPASTPAL